MKNKIIFGIIVIFIIISITVFISIVFSNKDGDIKKAEIVIEDSEIYSKNDIESAISIVLNEFKNFPATLNKIWYDDQQSRIENDKLIYKSDTNEAIVLSSNFKTYPGKQALYDGFDSNTEYSNWNWILVRTNHDEWKLKTWGY